MSLLTGITSPRPFYLDFYRSCVFLPIFFSFFFSPNKSSVEQSERIYWLVLHQFEASYSTKGYFFLSLSNPVKNCIDPDSESGRNSKFDTFFRSNPDQVHFHPDLASMQLLSCSAIINCIDIFTQRCSTIVSKHDELICFYW